MRVALRARGVCRPVGSVEAMEYGEVVVEVLPASPARLTLLR